MIARHPFRPICSWVSSSLLKMCSNSLLEAESWEMLGVWPKVERVQTLERKI